MSNAPRNRDRNGRRLFRAVVLALLAVTAGALAASVADAGPGDPISDKMIRQIGVMEKIIDKVLLDSPNFLVSRGDNARGLYLESFGVVFTFDASMTSPQFALENYLKNMGERFEVFRDKDGNDVIRIKTKDLEKDAEELEKQADQLAKEADKMAEKARVLAKNAEDAESGQKLVYEEAKKELVQVLLDYGETMTSLRDGQSLLIAAFFERPGPYEQKFPTHLVVSAKIDDLRSFANGGLDETEMRSRIKIDEY